MFVNLSLFHGIMEKTQKGKEKCKHTRENVKICEILSTPLSIPFEYEVFFFFFFGLERWLCVCGSTWRGKVGVVAAVSVDQPHPVLLGGP